MFRDALIITCKDLRLLSRDRRAFVVLLVLPLILMAVIGSSAGRMAADSDRRSAAVESAGSPASTDSIRPVGASPEHRVYRSIVPGYTVLFVFFLVSIMGRSFLQERELGTLQRLQMAPISSTAILLGKMLPFFVVSVIQTAVLLLSGIFLFGMSPGARPELLVPLAGSTSLAAVTLGLAFAVWVRSDAQVSAWGNLLVLGTAGISGCLVPRHWMPELSRQISLATPHAWALEAYREILVSPYPDVRAVAGCCGILLLFSAVFFVVGLAGFRNT